MNECDEGIDDCHENADCYDTVGNFTCMCSPGYSGDGVENCTGKKILLIYAKLFQVQCILDSKSLIPRY